MQESKLNLLQKIQKELSDSSIKLSDTLMKMLVLSIKVDLPELTLWLNSEMDGYLPDQDVPNYRNLILRLGYARLWNPVQGTIEFPLPDSFIEEVWGENFIEAKIKESISHVEDLSCSESPLVYKTPFHPGFQERIHGGQVLFVYFLIDRSNFSKISSAVRLAALRFSLDMEKELKKSNKLHLLDEERFDMDEVKKAASYAFDRSVVFLNNGSGSISVGAVQQNVEKVLESNGISKDSSKEILDVVAAAPPEEKKNALKSFLGGLLTKSGQKIQDGWADALSDQILSLM